VHVTICRTPERSYFITSDQVKALKAYEYSIYDVGGSRIQYRIEIRFLAITWSCCISKNKLVGKLRSKFRFLKKYEANFEVYDDRYKQWVKGVINEIHRREDKWKIQYDNHSISVAHKDGAATYFLDEERNNTVLAQYEWTTAAMFEAAFRFRKFYLHVHSKEIPHMVYFLYIAVVDRNFYQRV
jgi:hypothetical protein